MIYLKIFWTFIQIGFLAFGGGYATIPLIQNYIVQQNGWISIQEMTDLLSISQMTPGPIALNAATFVGTKIAGIFGSLVATSGIILPAFVLLMLLARFIFSENKLFLLEAAVRGIKPGITGLIAIAALSMFRASVYNGGTKPVSLTASIVFFVGLILSYKKTDMTKMIVIGAVLGIVLESCFRI